MADLIKRINQMEADEKAQSEMLDCCESRLFHLLLGYLSASGNMIVITAIGENMKDSLDVAFFGAFPAVQSMNYNFYFICSISFKNSTGNSAKLPTGMALSTGSNS